MAKSKEDEVADLVGSIVQDRYRVVRLLGEGGMGEVYEVEHVRIGRRLALKRLHTTYANDESILERFHREARAATMIGNKHIVEVTDMGELPDGSPYIVLEFLKGRDLSQLLRDEGALPVSRVVSIMRQVCDGLAAAHDKGIVHRDLKPENIFLLDDQDHEDFVKLLDFGISKIKEKAEEVDSLTATGQALGTPFYMSVEQAHGQRDIDGRTDIYALGVILYRMLTGRLPFQSETYMTLMVEILTEDPPMPSVLRENLPVGLEEVVMTALAKDRALRYQTAQDLMAALEPFADDDEPPRLSNVGLSEGSGGIQSPTALETPRSQAGARGPTIATMPEAPEGDSEASTDPEVGMTAATMPEVDLDGGRPPTDPEPERSKGAFDATAPAIKEPIPATEVALQSSKPELRDEDSTSAPPASGGIRRLFPIFIGAALFFVGLGAILAARPDLIGLGAAPGGDSSSDSRDQDNGANLAAINATKATKADAAPAQKREVQVKISATPPEAKIFIGDVEYPNPTDAFQPRSLRPVRIKIQAEGFRTLEQLAILDQDRVLEYELEAGGGTERLEPERRGAKRARGVRRGSGTKAASRPREAESTKAPAQPRPVKQPVKQSPGEVEVYQGPRGNLRDSFD